MVRDGRTTGTRNNLIDVIANRIGEVSVKNHHRITGHRTVREDEASSGQRKAGALEFEEG